MEKNEIIKFKKLLAYFVSHLEWVNSKNDNSRGYVDYIKPFVDNKTFRVTGQGYNGDKIQNQIEQWSDFEHGKICITVQANFGNYKTSKCYLNWKGTGLNIVSTWDNDSIISLYQEEYQNQDGKRSRMRLCEAMSVESLGLFDETEISPNLVSFFEDFDNQIVKFIQHNRNIVEAKEVESSIEPISYSKQIILYGPPGTGKTYKTIDRALAIIECKSDKSSSPQDRKVRYQHYVDRGQILFTTFHQSMSYEDFVEGIKPKFDESEDGAKQLVYEVESGLFKIACAHAAYNSYLELQNKSPNKRNYTFDDLYTSFIDYVQDCLDNDIKPTYKSLSGRETSIIKINGNGSIHAHAKNSSGIKSPAPLTKDNLQKLYDRYKDTSEIKSLSQVREVVG
ncbi:hypothetical protein KUH03_08605 [Sphingobacterium sp. E70]|uniref:hypothetical protein n=1 Tax=Sphingobacterium sp. E70 TaxID=2853439 RepID=UPI00211CA585|nr:hypothetical protein [Sphingobacterium sp. E70]ULT26868.1 hypothetical protein KUH03_08605 [Sphingobacterium sp. E70]